MKALFPVVIDLSSLIPPVVSAAKLSIIAVVIVVYQALKPWWVLPEGEQARCRRIVAAEYRREVGPVAASGLSDQTKARILAYYEKKYEKRFNSLCGGR